MNGLLSLSFIESMLFVLAMGLIYAGPCQRGFGVEMGGGSGGRCPG